MNEQNTNSLAEKVKVLINSHLECNGSLLSSSIGKEIVCFLGYTGSGKSTLLNFLSGRELQVDKKSIVLKNPADTNSCKIGNTQSSSTLLPQCIEHENIMFYDFAGFEDNRGVEYSLLNACFIKWIIEKASSVLFVIVAEESTFSFKRGEPFIDLINKIKLLIPGIESTKNNILVMTKVDEWEEEEFQEYIQDEKINISKIVKDNIDLKILKMSKPSKKEINQDDRISILKAIKSEKGMKIRSVNIEAIYSLKENAIIELLYEIVVQEIYEKLFPNINISELDKENLIILKTELESILLQFHKQIESNQLIEILKNVSLQIFFSCFDKYEKRIQEKQQGLHIEIKKLIEIIDKNEKSKKREELLNKISGEIQPECFIQKDSLRQFLIYMEFQKPHFKDFEYLGDGAFALVLKAFNTKSNSNVALKILNCSNSKIQSGINAMKKEYEFLKQFYYNDYTVNVFECFYLQEQKFENEDIKDSKNSFLIMEMELCKYSLKNFFDEVRMSKKYPDQKLKEYFAIQMLDGLNSLHNHNIIHRDVKPQNFLISQDDSSIKICDLGFASSLTKSKISKSMKGTEQYFAPEIENRQQRIEVKIFNIAKWYSIQHLKILKYKKSDLFSLGLVLLELDNLSIFSIDQMNRKDKNELHDGKGILTRMQIDRQSNLYQIIEICLKPNYQERTSAAELLEKLIVLHQSEIPFLLYSIIIENQLDQLVKVIIKRLNQKNANKQIFPYKEDLFLSILQQLYHSKKYLGSFFIVNFGSEGVIMGAKSALLNRNIILKIQKIDSIKKIKDEVQIMKEIQNPQIVQFYDYYLILEYKYVVFEFERCSCSLSEYLERQHKDGYLNEDQKMSLSLQIIDSVNYIHSFDIIHRDIKPDNILIIENNNEVIVKLSDFGFSTKLKDGKEITSKISDSFAVGLVLCQIDNFIKLVENKYDQFFMNLMNSQIKQSPFESNGGSELIDKSTKIYEFIRQLVVLDRKNRKQLSFIVDKLPQKLFSKKEEIQKIINEQIIKENSLKIYKQLQNVFYYQNNDQNEVDNQSNSIFDITDFRFKQQKNQTLLQKSENNVSGFIENYFQEQQYCGSEISYLEQIKNMFNQNINERFHGISYEQFSNPFIQLQHHNLRYNSNFYIKKFKEKIINCLQDRVFLIIGNYGVGKSSFVQKIAGYKNVLIGDCKQPTTQQCNLYVKNEFRFIDTPGIDDTQDNRFEILLMIAKFLHINKYKLNDIFPIYIQNNNLPTHKKYLAMLSLTYFLYKIFNGDINSKEIEKFIGEYFYSSYFLNWSECGFHLLNDEFSEKRKLIFSNKDIASNYYQQFDFSHIVVKTKFDRNLKRNLEFFNQNKMEFIREQVWSSKQDDSDLMAYKKYIQYQEEHLFLKIYKIIQMEIENQKMYSDDNVPVQNILLLGKPQVGKSSLIEQLIFVKGLRGYGQQSMYQVCQMLPITYNNVRYRFIDTPSYYGAETNQFPLQMFKIIADFLRRNSIIEFKIIYMKDSQTDYSDDMESILKQIQFFIQYVFDQDSQFIDKDYINYLYQFQSQLSNFSIKQLRNRIIQINRISFVNLDLNITKDAYKVINIQFLSNILIDKREDIEVNQLLNRILKDNLFYAIDQLEFISIEEKIQFLVQHQQQIEILETQLEYEQAYKKIYEMYEYLNKLQLTILYAKEENAQLEVEQLLKIKLNLIQDIKSLQFIIVGQINQIKVVEKYAKLIKISNIIQNRLQNDIQKHFIFLKFQPIHFETISTSKNNLLFRKQKYCTTFQHQLNSFIQNGNKNHLEILEDLAQDKLIKEITLISYLQQKFIEINYDRSSKTIIKKTEAFAQGIIDILGTGVQLYRYPTQFYLLNEASVNITGLQSSDQFKQGTKLFNGFSLFYLLAYPLNIINLIIDQSTEYLKRKFLEAFDETIGLFIKRILDDTLPSQFLYFQKSDFLKSKYNICNYSQLDNNEGNEMFKKLQQQYSQDQDQLNQILQNLFNINQDNNHLQDTITQYIVSNIISQQLQLEEYNSQYHWEYLPLINSQVRNNQQIINSFYNRFDNNLKKEVIYQYKQLKDFIKNKQKELKNQINHQQILNKNEVSIIQQYISSLTKFKKFIQENKYSYDQQVEFGNGYMRKKDYFPILYNSYCNLIGEKVNYLFQEQKHVIKELKKSKKRKCLKLNSPNFNFAYFQKMQLGNKDLYLLNISEVYCSSRYLQKIIGQGTYLTYISQQEIIDGSVEYSIDLHELAKCSKGFEDFIYQIKLIDIDYDMNLFYDIQKRLKYFYQSYVKLTKIFI